MPAELEGQEVYRQIEPTPNVEYLPWDLLLFLRREQTQPKVSTETDRISLQVIFNASSPDYNARGNSSPLLPLNVKQFHELIDESLKLWQDYVSGTSTTPKNLISGGQQFFQKLFGTPAEFEEDLYFFRAFLRYEKRPLRIRVIAPPDLQFPWNLLYVSNEDAVSTKWVDGFLGARHTVVQHLDTRLSERRKSRFTGFATRETMHISLHRDKSDPQLKDSLEGLLSPLEGEKCVSVFRRDGIDPLLEDLQRDRCSEDFMYFCCHGGQAQPNPAEVTCLLFGSMGLYPTQFSAALGDGALTSQPIVFINSCYGGKIGRTYFESFVPIFLTSGASTVVGPTVGVKKDKALYFAERFVEELLLGRNLNQPQQEIIPDIVQRVRRGLLQEDSPDLTPLLFQSVMRVPVHFSRRFKRLPGVTPLAESKVAIS